MRQLAARHALVSEVVQWPLADSGYRSQVLAPNRAVRHNAALVISGSSRPGWRSTPSNEGVVTIYSTLLSQGYFPKELPPAFFTEDFSDFARTGLGRTALQSYAPQDNFTQCVGYRLALPGLSGLASGTFGFLTRTPTLLSLRLSRSTFDDFLGDRARRHSPRADRSTAWAKTEHSGHSSSQVTCLAKGQQRERVRHTYSR